MRIYHFSNFYLSSIQQGIQAAHAQMEMFVKYDDYSYEEHAQTAMLMDWSKKHKTMICLNGGMHSDLVKIYEFIDSPENPYPWSMFVESEDALKGMLTNVAIVLPERIYETASLVKNRKAGFVNKTLMTYVNQDNIPYIVSQEIGEFTQFEIELINLLNSCSLAR